MTSEQVLTLEKSTIILLETLKKALIDRERKKGKKLDKTPIPMTEDSAFCKNWQRDKLVSEHIYKTQINQN